MNKIINQVKNIVKSEYFLLTVILFLAFIIRLYKIDNPIADWHSWRQSDTASVSKTFIDKGIDILHPRYQDISSIQTGIFNPQGYRMVEFPIFNIFHAILAKSSNLLSFEEWGRMVTIMSSLISALFIFFLGKKYIGRWGGILASFFFLFLPYNVYFSRVILPDPMAVTFIVISLWLFSEFIDKEKIWPMVISGAFFGLAMLIKPFVIFYSVPLFYLAISKYGVRRIFTDAEVLIKLLVFASIALVPFFLWRIWINQYPAGIPFFEWAFNGDKIRFRPSFWRWIFGERLGYLILGTWGLVPFVLGMLSRKSKNYFVQFALLGSLLYVFVVATANVRHDYYQILVIPAIALALGQGALYLWDSKEFPKLLARGILAFAVLVMLITSVTQVKEFYKVNHPEIIEAGRALDKITPKDALVIAPYNGDTAFLYQTGRWGWPAIDDSLDNLIKKGAGYYVSVNFADKDTIYVASHYRVLAKTASYLIADLNKPIK